MNYEIRRSEETPTEWYWRIVADNGEPLAHSETYKRRIDAERAAMSVIVDDEPTLINVND